MKVHFIYKRFDADEYLKMNASECVTLLITEHLTVGYRADFHSAKEEKETTQERKSQTSLIPVALLYFHSLLFNVFVIICIPSDQWVNRSIHNK